MDAAKHVVDIDRCSFPEGADLLGDAGSLWVSQVRSAGVYVELCSFDVPDPTRDIAIVAADGVPLMLSLTDGDQVYAHPVADTWLRARIGN